MLKKKKNYTHIAIFPLSEPVKWRCFEEVNFLGRKIKCFKMIFLPAIPLFYFMSITVKILSWHSISTWTISKRNQLRKKKGILKKTDCMKYKDPFRFHLEMHFFWSGLWSEAFISHFQFKWHWYRYNQVIFTNTWKKKVFRDNSTMTLSWSTVLRKLQYIIACLH